MTASDNPTLKRLEEIEANYRERRQVDRALNGSTGTIASDVLWLCARLRDALAVIAQAPLAEATAAYRRLFGHAEVGEVKPLPLGHPYSTFVNGNGPCTACIPTIVSPPGERPVREAWRCCSQPRAAHEPLPAPLPKPKL